MAIFDSMREAAAKRREEAEKQRLAAEAAILAEKKGIIERNSAFFEQVLSVFEPERLPEFPWIAQKESFKHSSNRTVFIGYEDLHVYNSGPPKSTLVDTESDVVWPETFSIISGRSQPYYYTKLSLTYPDHFNYYPISEYVNKATGIRFSEEEVLQLVAEEIHRQISKKYPAFGLGDLKKTKSKYHSGVYFYFEYSAPYKKLSSW